MTPDELEARSKSELIAIIEEQRRHIAELQTQIAQLRLLATRKNGAELDTLDAALAQGAPPARLPLVLRIVLIAAAVFTCAVVLVIANFKPSAPVNVGRAQDFQPGTVRAIQLPALNTADPALPVYLVGTSTGGVLALYRQDPYSGCLVEWSAARLRFQDPCSESSYALSGEWIEGPAPRGLDRFAVTIEGDGAVSVDVNARQTGPPRP